MSDKENINYPMIISLLEQVKIDLTDCICELMTDDDLQEIVKTLKLAAIKLQDQCRTKQAAQNEL